MSDTRNDQGELVKGDRVVKRDRTIQFAGATWKVPNDARVGETLRVWFSDISKKPLVSRLTNWGQPNQQAVLLGTLKKVK